MSNRHDNRDVLKRDRVRLDEIEQQLLDETKPLAGALRKCVALGGELRSAPLREWASQELKGYESPGAVLPDYRCVEAPIMIDGAVPGGYVKQQRIAPSDLPDFAHDHVSETVELRGGVGTLEDLMRTAKDDGLVKLSLPMAAALARFMNQQTTGQIVDLYWGVSVSAIHSVIDRIRTSAVEIMSELRAGAPEGEQPLTPDAADQAVNVVLHGGKRHRVTVNTAQVQGGSTASVPLPEGEESWWAKTATIWTIIGVAIAAVALYVAYRQWRG